MIFNIYAQVVPKIPCRHFVSGVIFIYADILDNEFVVVVTLSAHPWIKVFMIGCLDHKFVYYFDQEM